MQGATQVVANAVGWSKELLAVVAAIAGAFIGGVFTTFKHEIRAFVLGGSKRLSLVGDWDATWTIATPAGHPHSETKEVISLKSADGRERYSGTASNDRVGQYKLDAVHAGAVIAYTMRCQGEHDGLLGTALLQKTNNAATEWAGTWSQWTDAMQLVSGTVTMKKK